MEGEGEYGPEDVDGRLASAKRDGEDVCTEGCLDSHWPSPLIRRVLPESSGTVMDITGSGPRFG